MIARDMLVMLLSLSVAMLALAPLWPEGLAFDVAFG
jgi:hypothetical protein